jgi:hypothetical protein
MLKNMFCFFVHGQPEIINGVRRFLRVLGFEPMKSNSSNVLIRSEKFKRDKPHIPGLPLKISTHVLLVSLNRSKNMRIFKLNLQYGKSSVG